MAVATRFDPIEALLARIRKSKRWPLDTERKAWERTARWRAFLDNDRRELRKIAGWDDRTDVKDRRYRVDPIPDRIASAWSDHLFSELLEVEPANESDADRLGELIEEIDLTTACREAERDYVAAEGEGWWRWSVDPELSDAPILEWHSRLSVAPLFRGGRLMACALISVLEGPPNEGVQATDNTVFRLFEVHAEGEVANVLFRGTKDKLGGEVDLGAHPESEELEETWEHDLPMLMGRVVNKTHRSPRAGISEFDAVEDYLLELNEAMAIGWENMRLTAKRRVVVSESSVQAIGATRPTGDDLIDRGDGSLVPRSGVTFDAAEDVLIADPLNEELGKDTPAPFKVLEYTFDAEALIAHKRDLVETALTRLGITPSWVGVNNDEGAGLALSGTARRIALMPTTLAGDGKAKKWDKALPQLLRAGQMLDALPEGEGGLGNQWTGADEAPGVKRGEALPEDPQEEATTEATLVGAGVRSIETSIKAQHPHWTDDEVAEERDRIIADKKDLGAGGLGGLIA